MCVGLGGALRTFLIAPCTWEHGADERGLGLALQLELERSPRWRGEDPVVALVEDTLVSS